MFWNLGTLIGALAGEAIDPETYGLDAAFPAAFVAMLAPHLRTRIGRAGCARCGALICLVLDAVRADRRADPVRFGGGAARVCVHRDVDARASVAGGSPLAYAFKVLGLVVIGAPQLPRARSSVAWR